MRHLMRDFANGLVTEEFFDQSFESRLGSMKHADTYHLREQYKAEAAEIKRVMREAA